MAAIAVAAPGAPLSAQDHDAQQWTMLTLQGRINEKIVVQADIQSRLTDDASRLGVIQISPSVGYKFSKNVTSVAGYMFAHADPADRPAKDEHRLYEQVTYPLGQIGKVRLTARTRVEERMVVGSQVVVWRLRQQARAQMPLTQAHGPILVAWTEAFYNLNDADWGARAGPDRWRNFLGVDVTVGKHIMLEPGVIEQIVFRKGKDHFDHIASITMTYKF